MNIVSIAANAQSFTDRDPIVGAHREEGRERNRARGDMLNWFRKHGFGQHHRQQPVGKSRLSSSAPDLTEDEEENSGIVLEKVVPPCPPRYGRPGREGRLPYRGTSGTDWTTYAILV